MTPDEKWSTICNRIWGFYPLDSGQIFLASDKRECLITNMMRVIKMYARHGDKAFRTIPKWLNDAIENDNDFFKECFEEAKVRLLKNTLKA